MKMIKNIFISLVALSTIQAQGQWNEVEWAQTYGISNLDFIDDNVGYAYMHELQGFTSVFQKTTDGGQNWTEITLPAPFGTEFQDLDFYGDGQGVILSRSWDNGETNTQVFQTNDDGENWEDISPSDVEVGYGLGQINFLNENLGFFVTGESFYTTSDGGENWSTTALPKAAVSVSFIDEMNGTIGTWDGTFMYTGGMLSTTDGGETWIETTLEEYQSVVGRVIQIDETTAYAAPAQWGASGQTQFYKTTDNGLNWVPIAIPTTTNDATLSDIDFLNEQKGVAAVSVNNEFAIYYTSDGGENWELQNEISEFYLTGLDLTQNSGYFTGQSGEIYRLSNPLSISDKNILTVDVFPNPAASGQILRWETTEQFLSASIVDITGKVVHKTVLNQTQSLQVPNLNRGIYFLSLTNETSQHITKIVID